jgi:hypothetical protein
MMRKRLSLCLLCAVSAGALMLNMAWAANKPDDRAKGAIEGPAKQAIGAAAPVIADDNPRVAPGKVNWHPSFEAACAASKKSGKPVLLFQLLGQLDKQFC